MIGQENALEKIRNAVRLAVASQVEIAGLLMVKEFALEERERILLEEADRRLEVGICGIDKVESLIRERLLKKPYVE